MKAKEEMEINKIHNIDFLNNTLPDKSAQLIIADPPYFEIKGDFDFIWASFERLPSRRGEMGNQYEDLRNQYENKRRPFDLPYIISDVFDYTQEGHITGQYEHDTKKPETLTRMLITVSSRPNDLVVVPFSGSGTECAMSAKEGRNFIGFDIEKKYCDMGNKRASWYLRQKSLF